MRPDARARALDRFVQDIRELFGDRLQAVVVYGPHASADAAPAPGTPVNTFVLASAVTRDDLAAAARRTPAWRRAGLATPLLLSRQEFVRSLDAFPLEFGAILARHRVLVGEAPFEGLAVRSEDVRRACEVQVKSHLIHLREGFLETGGRALSVARLVAQAAPAFVGLAETIARLERGDGSEGRSAVHFVQMAAGFPADVADRLVALAQGQRLARRDALRFFYRYLAAVEQLAEWVDRWGG